MRVIGFKILPIIKLGKEQIARDSISPNTIKWVELRNPQCKTLGDIVDYLLDLIKKKEERPEDTPHELFNVIALKKLLSIIGFHADLNLPPSNDELLHDDGLACLYEVLVERKVRILRQYNFSSRADIVEVGMVEYIMEAIRKWFRSSVENECFDCCNKRVPRASL
jgi:hypothetical protein